MDPRRIPVLQSFKITTPSVTVTVTADDTPLPDGAPVLSAPGNLVTVSTPQKVMEGHTTTAASVPATPTAAGGFTGSGAE